jgi:release factor glutamine methyltransferase
VCALSCLALAAWPAAGVPPTDTSDADLNQGKAQNVPSSFLGGSPVLVLPGVFLPAEAEQMVLPFMAENRDLFRGKSVLEIGTGSGIISVYAARLGAKRVVSTDISEVALKNADQNAERFDVASVIETRLVPPSDMSAYSVIKPGESFDIIISNPPYSLDLEAEKNTAVTDRGDLGFSIVRGLETHLAPGGRALLYYGSLFYHHVMVKFARHEGFDVRNHGSSVITPGEAETLFNAYLSRLLQHEKMEPDSFRFSFNADRDLWRIRVATDPRKAPEPLVPGNSNRWFPGWMVIQRKQPPSAAPSARRSELAR